MAGGSLQKLAILVGFDIDAKSVDAAINSVNSIDKQMGQLGRSASKFIGLLGAGGIGAGLYHFAKTAVEEFAKEETAILKLQNALDNIGVTDKSVTADLIAFAKATQLTTMATDEEIIAIQTTLIQRGLWGDALKQAIKDSINLASKTGDLAGAANIVGASFQGVTRGLRQFGIAIDTHMPKAQIFEAVHKQINEHFAGAAQAQMAGYAGHLHIMTVEMDELKKRMGEQMEPVFLFWIDKFGIILDDIDKLGEKASKSGGNIYQSALPGLQKQLDILNISAASYSNYHAKVPAALQQQIEKMEKIIEQTKRYEAAKNTPAAPGSNKPTKGIGAEVTEVNIPKGNEEIDNATTAWLRANHAMGEYYFKFIDSNDNFVRAIRPTEELRAKVNDETWKKIESNWKEAERKNKQTVENMKAAWEEGSRHIGSGFQQALLGMEQSANNWRNNWTGVMNGATSSATGALNRFFKGGEKGFHNFGRTAEDIFKGIRDAFFQMLEEMAARAIITGFFKLIAGAATGGGSYLPEILSLKPSYAEGGPIPGSKGQGMPILAHGGEYVLPAGVVDAIKAGKAPGMASVGVSGGGGGVSITQNITVGGSGGSDGDIGRLCQAISEATRNGLRQAGEMANVITKVGTKKSGVTAL